MGTLLMWLLGVAVFLSVTAGDIVEAYYVRSVADLDPYRASVTSMLMGAISLVGWAAVFGVSWWYLIPEMMGYGAGPWIAVRRMQRTRARLEADPNIVRLPDTSTVHRR